MTTDKKRSIKSELKEKAKAIKQELEHNKENIRPLIIKESSISKISNELETRKTRSGKTGLKVASNQKENETENSHQ